MSRPHPEDVSPTSCHDRLVQKCKKGLKWDRDAEPVSKGPLRGPRVEARKGTRRWKQERESITVPSKEGTSEMNQ